MLFLLFPLFVHSPSPSSCRGACCVPRTLLMRVESKTEEVSLSKRVALTPHRSWSLVSQPHVRGRISPVMVCGTAGCTAHRSQHKTRCFPESCMGPVGSDMALMPAPRRVSSALIRCKKQFQKSWLVFNVLSSSTLLHVMMEFNEVCN